MIHLKSHTHTLGVCKANFIFFCTNHLMYLSSLLSLVRMICMYGNKVSMCFIRF